MRRALALLIPLVLAGAAPAPPKAYVRDAASSRITFVVKSWLLDARGSFERWDAEILFDVADLPASSVRVTIDAKSIDTGIGRRDRHVRGDDFLATDSFPTIAFRSTRIRRLGADTVEITGDLTIRGHTKSIAIPSRLVTYDAGTETGRVVGRTTILRDDFGVSYQSRWNRVDPEVELGFDITFRAKR